MQLLGRTACLISSRRGPVAEETVATGAIPASFGWACYSLLGCVSSVLESKRACSWQPGVTDSATRGWLGKKFFSAGGGVSPKACSEHVVIVAPTFFRTRRNGQLAEFSDCSNWYVNGLVATGQLVYRTGNLSGSGKSSRVLTTSYPPQLVLVAHLIHDAKPTRPMLVTGRLLPLGFGQKMSWCRDSQKSWRAPTCEFI